MLARASTRPCSLLSLSATVSSGCRQRCAADVFQGNSDSGSSDGAKDEQPSEGGSAAGDGADGCWTRVPGATAFEGFVESLDLLGDWEQLHGNYVLRPRQALSSSPTLYSPPKAVLHFLGGAFAGSAPQLTYRWLLQRLAARGYVVVATPYRLSFDHLATVDAVLSRFESAAASLALDYGDLPVIGVGHSLGSLLHVVAGALFGADGKHAANVLISFNNKSVEEAIPLFRQVISPVLRGAVAADRGALSSAVERMLLDAPATLETLSDSLSDALVPRALRESMLPLLRQARPLLQQVPPLLAEVADGTDKFNPAPDEVRMAVEAAYGVPHTLLVKFANDALDETELIEEALRARGNLSRAELRGTHLTPCSQDIMLTSAEDGSTPFDAFFVGQRLGPSVLGRAESARDALLREASELDACIGQYLERLLPML